MSVENTLESLEIYKLALKISDKAWKIYKELPKSFQYHIGNQLLDAADSIGGTISEGYGRYHYKDKINFNYYARGSSYETRHWIKTLWKRELISQDTYNEMNKLTSEEISKINAYNSYLRKRIKEK